MAKRTPSETYAELGQSPQANDIVRIRLGAVALGGIDTDLVEWREEADNGVGMVIRPLVSTAGNLWVVLVTPQRQFRELGDKSDTRFMAALELNEMVPVGVARVAMSNHVHVGEPLLTQ